MSNVTEKDLLLALLSLDAYHQGYERGIEHDKLQIGAAKRTGISKRRVGFSPRVSMNQPSTT
jgi:hypothetical protein